MVVNGKSDDRRHNYAWNYDDWRSAAGVCAQQADEYIEPASGFVEKWY
jgi:hypothetical protein